MEAIGDVVPSVPSCCKEAHATVAHYGLSLTATVAALSISKQSVLRGLTAGAHVLATTGRTQANVLPY
jgi:hypothetical protein